MTETLSTTSTTSTTAASITLSHAQLASIASLAACANTADYAPVIEGVQLVAAPGSITAAATNRYVVGLIEFFSDSITAEFDVTIPVKPLKQFVMSSKLTGRFNTDVERITISVTDDSITFSDLNTGSTLTTATIKGKFPPVARLFPDVSDDDTATISPYSISAKLLSTLAKIVVINDSDPSWIAQHTQPALGKTSPVLYRIAANGSSYKFLIQPRMKLR
jgi:DNA polymerase III sliding clamp (beta) subunit (PCNA family)